MSTDPTATPLAISSFASYVSGAMAGLVLALFFASTRIFHRDDILTR